MQLNYSRVYVDQQQIRKAGGEIRVQVEGNIHRIRGDFPFLIFADGDPIRPGGVNLATGQMLAGTWLELRRNVQEFRIVGLEPTTSLTFGSGLMRHGYVIIESTTGPDLSLVDYDVSKLPCHIFEFFEPALAADAQGEHGIQTAEADWLVSGVLPLEIYITQVGWHRCLLNTVATATNGVNGFVLWKITPPPNAGDSHPVFCAYAPGIAPLGGVCVPYHRLPLRSLLDQYAAEVPRLDWAYIACGAAEGVLTEVSLFVAAHVRF